MANGRGPIGRWALGLSVLLLIPSWLVLSAPAQARSRLAANYSLNGRRLKAIGTFAGANGTKVELEQRQGRRWRRLASGHLKKGATGSFAYSVAWRVPRALRAGTFRVEVTAGGKTVAVSRPRKLKLVTPKVKAVKSAQIKALPAKGRPTLVLAGNAKLKAGEFLAAPPAGKAPDGFLLRVISSHAAHGRTTVRVKPASIYEAVPNGQFSDHLSDLSEVKPVNADARLLSRALSSAGKQEPKATTSFSEKVSCESSETMTLSGHLDASLDPSFELK